jgi:tetrahydromethanopterin S-methyltransferase subunit A
MVYSDEGIFEIGRKIHKWCITDGGVSTIMVGRSAVCDASSVDLKESWQIPFPHDCVSIERRIYTVDAATQFVVDMSKTTTTYFRGRCQGVEEWLTTL